MSNVNTRNRPGKSNRQRKVQKRVMNPNKPFQVLGRMVLRSPFPDHEIVHYRYIEPRIMSGALSFLTQDYQMNSVWTPRISGNSGTASGYVASAARYSRYHVQEYRFKITCSSLEASNSVIIGVVASNTQPSTTITTYQQALTALTGSNCVFQRTIGPLSGNSVWESPVFAISPAKVVGNIANYNAEDNYNAAFGVNPVDIVYCTLVAVSAVSSGTNITSGVNCLWDAEIVTRNFTPLLLG